MRRLIFFATILMLLSILVVFWSENRQPSAIRLVPSLSGKPEYCLTCHSDLPEISASHPLEVFGCVICHGGEPLALDADLAHSTMRGGPNPSSLEVGEKSCGGTDCHSAEASSESNHIQRVMTSIQATYAGAITNVRFTFGAQQDLEAQKGTYAVRDTDGESKTGIMALEAFLPEQDNNPAILAFAENCLYCHISGEPLPGAEYERMTGCAACHTPTTGIDLTAEKRAPIHQLTTAIPYSQCNTCHNRGNYDLRDMQFYPRTDQPQDRLNDYYQPIAQFVRCEWTLDCIDCHTRRETMGDGDLHSSQADIQYVQCRTCHGTINAPPLTYTISDPNDIALRMAFLNPVIALEVGDTIIITEQGEPIWNTRLLPDGRFEQFGKATGQRFIFRQVMDTACEQNPEEQESRYCHQCHAVER